MEPVTIFTFIDQCRTKSRRHDFDPKIVSSYMLTLGLSNDNSALAACNAVNPYVFNMPKEALYEYFMETMPKTKTWVKWPKKDKKKEKLDKEIAALKKEHNVSTYEAKIILEYGSIE